MTDPEQRAVPLEVMNKLVLETLYHLEAEFDEGGWDQAPCLYMMRAMATDVEVADDQLAGAAALMLRPFPIPQEMWQAHDHPIDTLKELLFQMFLGALLRDDGGDGDDGAQMFGYVFVCEGWMRELPLDGRSGRERIEVRNVNAVDVTGSRYWIYHERDSVIREAFNDEVQGETPAVLESLLAVS